MIYIFYGDDAYSAQEALRALYLTVGPRDLWESNITQMDGASFDLAHFAAAAQAVPFLADRRLVTVRGLLGTAETQRGAPRRGRRSPRAASGPSPWHDLAQALDALPPTTDVAFVDGRLSRDNPLLQELGGTAKTQEFPLLRGEPLSRWVREHMAQKNGTLTPQAVTELVRLVGSNLWTMDNELEKLATYCNGRPVAPEDVRALVGSAREANIFALVDAIMERRPEAAMRAMEELTAAGATAPYLLSMIGRQARLVALAQALAQEKAPPAQWGDRLGIQQEFVLRKTIEQSRRFSSDQVRQLYRLLLEADLAIKSGEAPEEIAMVELLARATAMTTALSRAPA